MKMVSTRLVVAMVAVLFILAISVDAAYRKPPFNGSIFGKRSNTITGNFKIYQILKFLDFFIFIRLEYSSIYYSFFSI